MKGCEVSFKEKNLDIEKEVTEDEDENVTQAALMVKESPRVVLELKDSC